MSLLYGRSPNCTCVQLPGSGHQAGSLPPGCPEATTWGGVAGLGPHPRDSGWGQPAWLRRCLHPARGCNASCLWTSEVAGLSLWSGLLWRLGDGKPATEREEDSGQSAAVYRAEYAQIVLFFNINADWLWEICQADAYIPGWSRDGLSRQEIWGVLPKGSGIRTGGAVQTDKRLQDGWSTTQNWFKTGHWDSRLPWRRSGRWPPFQWVPTVWGICGGAKWTPGGIPPKICSPEYSGNTSDTSIDTQVACTIQAVSVTADPEPGGAVASTSARQDTRRVELTPLPGLTQQFTIQVEREIQKQIQEHSCQLVQDILQRSANRIMLPTPSEAARASLSQCFQKALATPRTKPAPLPEQLGGLTEGGSTQYSLTDPFAGINPPPPELLKESYSDHPARGRAATHLERPPEEKKRRSSSRPQGEADPKRGRSSGAEPSWDISKVGGWQSDKARSQPASEPEAPASMLKLKSVIKSVHLNVLKPEDWESLGPAARSRYDDSTKDDQPQRDSSRHRADAHSKPHSGRVDKGSGHSDRRSGQSPNPRSSKHKEESMGTKLMARKEREKKYKKIVDKPMLYLEEHQHQILLEEYQPEIHSLRFFGSGAEGTAIEVLALINWAAEYVEISRSPVPEIPGFLRRPFIKGKLVKHPIPDDPAESILKEKCVRTKVQKVWTYLCALLQFWTDEATTESGEVMYGGQRRPANPMIVRIWATLNPSFGDHFKITWASIAASTSWTQSHLYYRESDREQFRTEPGPTADLQNPLEATVEQRWERYLKEQVLETADLSFSTPSWAGTASRPLLLSRQPEARHPTEADSVPRGFARINRKTPEEQEATSYETPADSQKQSINEELGIQDVTDINEGWYPPPESESASAIKKLLDSQQPMEVDEAPEERQYQMFDKEAPDMLGPDPGPGSPVTATEDPVLDTPGGFSRAPGDGRPITGSGTGSSGRRIMGRTTEG